MKLLIYASLFDVSARYILRSVRSHYQGGHAVHLPTLVDLESYLRQPSHLPELVALMPKTPQELDHLIAISDLFRDTKVILVLPDHTTQMTSKAHRLRPRFISYPHSDPDRLISVVDKMMQSGRIEPVSAVQ